MGSILFMPYDILFIIARQLTVEDLNSLSQAASGLRWIVNDCSIAKSLIESRHPFSAEAELAVTGQIQWSEALRRLLSRCTSMATGKPASVHVMQGVLDFVLNHGVLVTLHRDYIDCIDLRDPQKYSTCITMNEVIGTLDLHCRPSISLIHYSDGVVFLLQKTKTATQRSAKLIAFNIETRRRRQQDIEYASTKRLSVVSDAQRAFICFYSWPTSPGGLGTWTIESFNLPGRPDSAQSAGFRIEMPSFARDEEGVDIAFRIHRGYFWAISAGQTVESPFAVPWDNDASIACYSLFRFPINDARQSQVQTGKFFRRSLMAGPLHNTLTRLSLHVDEASGDLVVVEPRGEWLDNSSTTSRTCYLTRVSVKNADMGVPTRATDQLLDLRTELTRHPMCGKWGDTSVPIPAGSKLKFHGYHAGLGAFVDLVVDKDRSVASEQPSFVLRTSYRSSAAFPDGVPSQHVDGAIRYTGVHLWTGCPFVEGTGEIYRGDKEEILRQMIDADIKAVMDGSFLVYMRLASNKTRQWRHLQPGQSKNRNEASVVVVSFEKGIDLTRPVRGSVQWKLWSEEQGRQQPEVEALLSRFSHR